MVVLLLIPLLLLSQGWRALGFCPLNPNVPVFLLVSGTLFLSAILLFSTLFCLALCRSTTEGQFKFVRLSEIDEGRVLETAAKEKSSKKFLFLLLGYVFVWTFWTLWGSYWMFRPVGPLSVNGTASVNGTRGGCVGSAHAAAIEWLALSYFLLFIALLLSALRTLHSLCNKRTLPKYRAMEEPNQAL